MHEKDVMKNSFSSKNSLHINDLPGSDSIVHQDILRNLL